MSTEPREYVPLKLWDDVRVPSVGSSWKGLERVVPDIVERFCLQRKKAIDFGVWYGYSTAVLANYFPHVIGVDTFDGDEFAGHPKDLFQVAQSVADAWHGIELLSVRWQDFIHFYSDSVGLIHVDVRHDYHDTYTLGLWAVDHAPVVLFHDTESFPEVRRAVRDLAEYSGRTFWNYPHHYGLGILVEGL